jgi:lipid II:glycine glycyltransferase (peptidoglycan interpeptide bridge formation enzyme)
VYRYRVVAPSDTSDEKTVLQFLCVEHVLPFGQRYIYIPHGPVIADGGTQERFDASVGVLREAVVRHSAVFCRLDLPFLWDGTVSSGALVATGFRSVKAVQPADTVVVDLRKNEEELLAAMHQKTRYNIRLAERHGVTIRVADTSDAEAFSRDGELFWSMLAQTGERDKFHTHPREYYETMLATLAQRNSGLNVRLAFAMHQGKAVAGGIFGSYGGTMTYLHGASFSADRNVMGPYLLHWEMMRQAKTEGCGRYDFWGVAPEGAGETHPWMGITRFKTGFGGERISYLGAWELPGNRLWYTLYRYAKRFRNV